MKLQKRLYEIMEFRNITLEQLSEKSGIPMETIRNIIYFRAKNPQINTISSIANALGTSVDYLIGHEADCSTAKLLHNYFLSSFHGKQALLTYSELEAERNLYSGRLYGTHHLRDIHCFRPTLSVSNGSAFHSVTVRNIHTKNREALFAIEIVNNEFSPTYCKGDIILFTRRLLTEGDTALIMCNSLVYLAQYFTREGKHIFIPIGWGRKLILTRLDCIHILGICDDIIMD